MGGKQFRCCTHITVSVHTVVLFRDFVGHSLSVQVVDTDGHIPVGDQVIEKCSSEVSCTYNTTTEEMKMG